MIARLRHPTAHRDVHRRGTCCADTVSSIRARRAVTACAHQAHTSTPAERFGSAQMPLDLQDLLAVRTLAEEATTHRPFPGCSAVARRSRFPCPSGCAAAEDSDRASTGPSASGHEPAASSWRTTSTGSAGPPLAGGLARIGRLSGPQGLLIGFVRDTSLTCRRACHCARALFFSLLAAITDHRPRADTSNICSTVWAALFGDCQRALVAATIDPPMTSHSGVEEVLQCR